MGGGLRGAQALAAPDAATLQKVRAVLPVLQENRAELQRFGLKIAGRLAELQTARAIGVVRDQLESI